MQIILLFTLDKYVLFWVIRTVKTEKNHVIFSTKRLSEFYPILGGLRLVIVL